MPVASTALKPDETAETLAGRVAQRVSNMIIRGDLAPGQRLNIKALADQFEVGQTPLREGLSRLLSTGLVAAIDQRGFRVTATTYEDLRDIIDTRLTIELPALALSIQRGDDAWEARVVATLHRLKKVMSSPQEMGDASRTRFDTVHKDFHMTLIDACGSPRMIQTVTTLYDQGFRYRCIMLSKDAESDYVHGQHRIEEHEQIAQAVIERNAEKAKAILYKHLSSVPEEIFGSHR